MKGISLTKGSTLNVDQADLIKESVQWLITENKRLETENKRSNKKVEGLKDMYENLLKYNERIKPHFLTENTKLKEQLKKQTKHSEKLSYKLANLKEVMKIILIDGYATESSINFNVMTGRHYFDLVKKVLNKQQ